MKKLIVTALRKPIAVIVMVIGLVIFGVMSITKINIDIFPNLNLPTIYVSQPYGGMSPQQMEGFVSTNYQNLYLYVSGIKTIETNNIQGLSLLKLSFYNGTNMAQAAAEVTAAIKDNNMIAPAGNVGIGNTMYMTPANTVIRNARDFEQIPLLYQNGATIYLKDVAKVTDGADITSGYAYVNGKRSIYIPIIKNSNASTWSVVQGLKQAIPSMQALLPEDVKLNFVFDQSIAVINSVKSLVSEGAIGAILTGLMVLLFLGDRRSALIVIINIPIAIITGTLLLDLFGQTINIMTLGGLALAIGILVDESTVTIENIHRHHDLGATKARAVVDACKEIALPKLLILLSILAVFVPALFMSGGPQGMFLPLSMAVGFSMIASFLLSQTLVPVLTNWFL